MRESKKPNRRLRGNLQDKSSKRNKHVHSSTPQITSSNQNVLRAQTRQMKWCNTDTSEGKTES